MSKRRRQQHRSLKAAWGEWVAYEPIPLPGAIGGLVEDNGPLWKNGVLAVFITQEQSEHEEGAFPLLHLSFRREDRKPLRDWRMVQRMKSELVGADVEAVELYPHEERLLDGANQYHLYCLPPGLGWPFGYRAGRNVADNEDVRKYYAELGLEWMHTPGRQRGFAAGEMDVARYEKGIIRQLGLFPQWEKFADELIGEVTDEE